MGREERAVEELLAARENTRRGGFSLPWDLARSASSDDSVTKSSRVVLRVVAQNARRGLFSTPGDLARRWSDDASVAKLAVGDEAVALIKASPTGFATSPGDQRFVLGVVLQPTADPRVGPDSQGDVYSSATVAAAERSWREAGQKIGLQHGKDISLAIEVLQSWITPVDCIIADQIVVAGSWLLAVRVLDDGLWADIKASTMSGFSIGGSGRRTSIT